MKKIKFAPLCDGSTGTRCKIVNWVYVGSLVCQECKNFISIGKEEDIILCKNEELSE